MSAKIRNFLYECPIAMMVQRLVSTSDENGVEDVWIRYAQTIAHYAGNEPSRMYPVNRSITITEQEALRKSGHVEPILSIYHRIRRSNPQSNREVLEDMFYTIQIYTQKHKASYFKSE